MHSSQLISVPFCVLCHITIRFNVLIDSSYLHSWGYYLYTYELLLPQLNAYLYIYDSLLRVNCFVDKEWGANIRMRDILKYNRFAKKSTYHLTMIIETLHGIAFASSLQPGHFIYLHPLSLNSFNSYLAQRHFEGYKFSSGHMVSHCIEFEPSRSIGQFRKTRRAIFLYTYCIFVLFILLNFRTDTKSLDR